MEEDNNNEMSEEDENYYDQILEMRNIRLSWMDIARELNWPIYKLYYFRKKYIIEDLFITINDDELLTLILQYQNQNLRWGEGMILGALNSIIYNDGSKLYIPRSQLRRVIQNNDQVGIELRKKNAVYRIIYKNNGVNYAWHLDGWHKLISYKIVVHGCVDGFSRKVIFLKASTNNKATTVFTSFFTKVEESHEIPALISVDGGGENVLVADYMIFHLGKEALKIVSSVHNQRIERLWRDVCEKAMIDYINLFADLRNESILDIENDQQIWLIHFLFLQLINEALQRFIVAWNNHSIRTEQWNLTPNQIEFFARKENHIYKPPEHVNVLNTGSLLDDFDIFDDNNIIPLVDVSSIQHPFNDDDDLMQFVEQVNLITTNDMRPGNIGIVKNKWINAFVVMMQIINR